MAGTAASDVTDGPVLSFINKRIRGLRKKYNRIIQLEEAISQGKIIVKEQEDFLRSKPAVSVLIDELEKLRQPLSVAVAEEVNLAVERHHHQSPPPPPPSPPQPPADDDKAKARASEDKDKAEAGKAESEVTLVEDLLNLLYFGSLFDVKPQSDFTSTMLTRTHERGCCLTYDYVTDDATDLLGERDLDLISFVGGLLISRPVDSSLSHKNALQRCIQRAKLWLEKSEQPIEPDSTVTYAGLRERLNKIMASDYFTTTPEMKAPVEVAAAAGNYGSFQVPVHGSMVPVTVPVQVEGSVEQYQLEDDDTANFQGHETGDDQSGSEEELHKEELMMENSAEVVSAQQEQVKPQAELEPNERDVESKEQQYIPRRIYQNQRGGRGGGGGRRGYSNGRGGRSSSRGGGSYQNGRNQYYDQPGNYYPRNYYNTRGRGGRGVSGYSFNNHGSAVQADGHATGDVGLGS